MFWIHQRCPGYVVVYVLYDRAGKIVRDSKSESNEAGTALDDKSGRIYDCDAMKLWCRDYEP